MENKFFYIIISVISLIILTNLILVYNSIITKIMLRKMAADKNEVHQQVKAINYSCSKLLGNYNALVNYVSPPNKR